MAILFGRSFISVSLVYFLVLALSHTWTSGGPVKDRVQRHSDTDDISTDQGRITSDDIPKPIDLDDDDDDEENMDDNEIKIEGGEDEDDEEDITPDPNSLIALQVGMDRTSSLPLFPVDRDLLLLKTDGGEGDDNGINLDVDEDDNGQSIRKLRSVDSSLARESQPSPKQGTILAFHFGKHGRSDDPSQRKRNKRSNASHDLYGADEYDDYDFDDDDIDDIVIPPASTMPTFLRIITTKAPENGSFFSALKTTIKHMGETIGEKLSLTGPKKVSAQDKPMEEHTKQKFTENAKYTVHWEEPVMLNNCWAQAMLAPRYAFSPSCKSDGTFTAKQCYLERCWCVTPEGTPQKEKSSGRFYYSLTGLLLKCKKGVIDSG